MTKTQILSTEDAPPSRRREWLCEVIGREYARADACALPTQPLFNEMTIYARNGRSSSRRSAQTPFASKDQAADAARTVRTPISPLCCYRANIFLSRRASGIAASGRDVDLRRHPAAQNLLSRRILKADRLSAACDDARAIARCRPLRGVASGRRRGIGAMAVSYIRSLAAHAGELTEGLRCDVGSLRRFDRPVAVGAG